MSSTGESSYAYRGSQQFNSIREHKDKSKATFLCKQKKTRSGPINAKRPRKASYTYNRKS